MPWRNGAVAFRSISKHIQNMKELKELFQSFAEGLDITQWQESHDTLMVQRNYENLMAVGDLYADLLGEVADKTGDYEEWGRPKTKKTEFLNSYKKSLENYFNTGYIIGLVDLRLSYPMDFSSEAIKLVARFTVDYCPQLANYLTSSFITQILFDIDSMDSLSHPELCGDEEIIPLGDRILNSTEAKRKFFGGHTAIGPKGALAPEN